MLQSIKTFAERLQQDFPEIPSERKAILAKIATFVREKSQTGQPALLTFICTHNSRRSHLGQIWAQTLAHHYGIAGVQTFSGGTEATAFHPHAIQALRETGFKIEGTPEANPHYQVRFDAEQPAIEAFSKTFQDAFNPQNNFCAIMTCDEADAACPFVPGAALRISLPYEDPKIYDGTPQQAAMYAERSHQIALEMAYAMFCVAHQEGNGNQ